jgi:isopenicillin-N N-acyltransferase-like protein
MSLALPLLKLVGTPYEQGLEHGTELKSMIKHNLDVYFERFESEGNLKREEVISRARRYRKEIASQNTDYFDNMQGISDGSGLGMDEVAVLNVRYELLYYQFMVNAMADGCTSFAVCPDESANGHLLLGQNWDWIPGVLGALLHTTDDNGLETLSFTEAGIAGGKIGFNSTGLGLTVNGMNTTEDDWSRLRKPFHVRCYEILRSSTVEDAVAIVTGSERSCSSNLMIAQAPNQVVDIEAAPRKVRVKRRDTGHLVHANHFHDPAGLGIIEPPHKRRKFSVDREKRLIQLLEEGRPSSVESIEGYFRDHECFPNSLCRHLDPDEPVEEQCITQSSVIMDLDSKVMRVCNGQPCKNSYQTVSID